MRKVRKTAPASLASLAHSSIFQRGRAGSPRAQHDDRRDKSGLVVPFASIFRHSQRKEAREGGA